MHGILSLCALASVTHRGGGWCLWAVGSLRKYEVSRSILWAVQDNMEILEHHSCLYFQNNWMIQTDLRGQRNTQQGNNKLNHPDSQMLTFGHICFKSRVFCFEEIKCYDIRWSHLTSFCTNGHHTSEFLKVWHCYQRCNVALCFVLVTWSGCTFIGTHREVLGILSSSSPKS